tara:strand:- start:813 stop:3476 length:2664 start_codon:yes stop_codon:yes gene_type:complete
MAVAPSNFVLKGYTTEADARIDTNALKVIDAGSSRPGPELRNQDQDTGYNFFTHTRYYFRIESNEPVSEFHIDWDDGEKGGDKGNTSVIKLKHPSFIGLVSHIFTRDKRHYVKIRVKSSGGFLSKWYSGTQDGSFANMGSFDEIETLQGETSLSKGRNDKYVVEFDNDSVANNARIPILMPTPKPPIGILKADKKRVYAGINNEYLVGADGDYDGITIYLVASSAIETNRTGVQVRVTYQVDTGGDVKVVDMGLPGSGGTTSITDVVKVLSMELLNHLEASSTADTDNLGVGEKIFLTTYSYGKFTIGEVSLGNPIVEIDNPRHTVTFDATESTTRVPDQTISNYYFDDGKGYYNQGNIADGSFVQTTDNDQISNVLEAGGNRYNISTIGVWKENYAFESNEHWCDGNGRFLPYQIMARMQCEVDSIAVGAGTNADTDATYSKSYIEHWAYSGSAEYLTRSVKPYNWTSDMMSSNLLAYKNMLNSDEWGDMDQNNRRVGGTLSSSPVATPDAGVLFSAKYDLANEFTNGAGRFGGGSSAAATSLTDTDNQNFLIIARDSQWDGQFWHIRRMMNAWGSAVHAPTVSPGDLTDTTGGYMNVRVNLYYAASENQGDSTSYVWKPLKYRDYTNYVGNDDTTWYTSGAWKWDIPSDWAKVDPDAINDKWYPGTNYLDGTGSFAYDSTTSGDWFEENHRWNANNKLYPILARISTDNGNAATANNNRYDSLDVAYTWPITNTHSQIVDVVDPMCVSLNSYGITSDISISHVGKYQFLNDRLGKTDIRKIGTASGTMTFSGVDISDTSREKFTEFQRNSVPVYIDVSHKNGDISRFFGIITQMADSHPTGGGISRFSINMQIAHMIEFNSIGTIISDGYVSLGGEIENEPKYIQ